ncbi:MAG TPA: isochorismatase family protein [Phycisphaerae bacterium]|nr:isochorismatase family protein [Phycisphaerae bacterium]
MGGRKRKPINWTRVLIDICTQNDYLEPGAILQVANRESAIGNLHRMFAWARTQKIPVVSCVESHRPAEPLNGCPMHCIDDTFGQRKPAYTMMDSHIMVEADNSLSLPPGLTLRYQQLLFRKRSRDILGNPKADRFLTQLHAEEFILFGVGLELAIRGLALGLLSRHKTVTVVSDACGVWSPADAELVLRQLSAKGIKLVTTEALTAPPPQVISPPRRIIYHGRVLRRNHPHGVGSASRRRIGRS